jgi:DNA-binding NtrC family response regulator
LDGGGTVTPELEFVFRTLFDLKLDVDDLRRDFAHYRERQQSPPLELRTLPPAPLQDAAPDREEEEQLAGQVVFRPGMTMRDLEREAIAVALGEADGNRRRAAERLGIGERTLYRKLKEYDLDL